MTSNASGSPEVSRSNTATSEALSLDSVFDALANQRRRYILQCLQKYENAMALADVADEIAVWEHETDITDISAEEVKRVYTSLYHEHIPKLAEMGIVEYHQERDVVALSEHADQVESILDSTTE